MPKQQRMMRVEQRSQLAAMQQLESRSDEELEAETKFKSAAQAILGARAAERYDAKAARAHFQRAIAAARPQERLQLRRMADASLALAERRADDLQARRPSASASRARPTASCSGCASWAWSRPPTSAGALARVRGIVLVIVLIVAILLIGFGIVNLVALPFGGISLDLGIFYGIVLVVVAIGVLAYFGRKRQQKRAQAERAEQIAARALTPERRCAAATRLAAPDPAAIRARFPIGEQIEVRQRFNVAPGDEVLAVTTDREGAPARRAAALGPGPVVGQEPGHRAEDDQRPGRDGGRAARLPRARSSASAA